MQGQWLGRVEGETTGNLIVDLDDCYDHFRGTARLFASGEPGVICELYLPKNSTSHDLRQIPLMWMPEGRPMIVSRDQIAELAPDMTFPTTARIKLKFAGQTLSAEWQSDIRTGGKAMLKQSQADRPSSIEPVADVQTWQRFKEFALKQEPGKFIFRGQPEAFRLRTAFHRTHRKDLVRYVAEDIPLAYKMLTARTRHLFDLSKSDQLGTFWNLLQHHGYPTPLLDWTYSPFVAAFFAYRRRARP